MTAASSSGRRALSGSSGWSEITACISDASATHIFACAARLGNSGQLLLGSGTNTPTQSRPLATWQPRSRRSLVSFLLCEHIRWKAQRHLMEDQSAPTGSWCGSRPAQALMRFTVTLTFWPAFHPQAILFASSGSHWSLVCCADHS